MLREKQASAAASALLGKKGDDPLPGSAVDVLTRALPLSGLLLPTTTTTLPRPSPLAATATESTTSTTTSAMRMTVLMLVSVSVATVAMPRASPISRQLIQTPLGQGGESFLYIFLTRDVDLDPASLEPGESSPTQPTANDGVHFPGSEEIQGSTGTVFVV